MNPTTAEETLENISKPAVPAAEPVRTTVRTGKRILAHCLSVVICIVMAGLFCLLTVRTGVSALLEESSLKGIAGQIDLYSIPLKDLPGVLPEVQNGTLGDGIKYYFSPLGYTKEDLLRLADKLSLSEEAAKLLAGYGDFLLYGDDCTELTKAYLLDFVKTNQQTVCKTLTITSHEFDSVLLPYLESSLGDSLKPLRTIELEMTLGTALPAVRFFFSIWCVILIAVMTALLAAAMTALHQSFRPVLYYTGAAALAAGLFGLILVFCTGPDSALLQGLIPAAEILLQAGLQQIAPTLCRAGFFFLTLGILAILWAVFAGKVRKLCTKA